MNTQDKLMCSECGEYVGLGHGHGHFYSHGGAGDDGSISGDSNTQDRTIRVTDDDLKIVYEKGYRDANYCQEMMVGGFIDFIQLKQPEKQEIEIAEELHIAFEDKMFEDVIDNRKLIIELQKVANKLLEK